MRLKLNRIMIPCMLIIFTGILILPNSQKANAEFSSSQSHQSLTTSNFQLSHFKQSNVQPSNLQPVTQTQIRDFALLTPQTGWLILGQELYKTQDGGQDWNMITPPGTVTLWAVNFLNENQGWAIISTSSPVLPTAPEPSPTSEISDQQPTNLPETPIPTEEQFVTPSSPTASPTPNIQPPTSNIQLAITSDGGQTWQILDLPVQPFPNQPGLQPGQVYLFFSDPQTGWIVFEQPTSSNFSLGSLYRTIDGGVTWQSLSIPIAAPVWFSDALNGYTQGGVSGAERYASADGGVSWQAVSGLSAPAESYFMRFEGSQSTDITGTGAGQPDQNMPATQAPPQRVSMLDGANGWGFDAHGQCPVDQPKETRTCTLTQRLFQTSDGGTNWSPVSLPADLGNALIIDLPAPVIASPEPGAPSLTATGQFFDKCEVPTLAQLQEWWNQSPYSAVNLYIGGISRGCSNAALNASYLSSMDKQGWRLVPTWVGPQAACTTFYHTISYDPNKSYQQGIDEANAAADTATALKMWGQAIYYDMEYFDISDPDCLASAQSFMDAWSGQLHLRGFVAGVYSSPCSGLPYFASADNVPDAVWIAHWIYKTYDPNATVWDVACMSNSYWANHQRLRQYAGSHNETWGTVSLNMDSNVMDGFIAQAYGQPLQACPAPGSAPAGVILYAGSNYTCGNGLANYGYVWRQGGGLKNVSGFFEDRASAIFIPSGSSVKLYENLDGGGGNVCLNASTADFTNLTFNNGHGLNDQVSSMAIYSGSNCSTAAGTPSSDTTPPQVAITNPPNKGYINGVSPVQITANLQDSGSGISHAQFFAGYDTGSGWAWKSLGYDTNASDGWSISWDPTSAGDQPELGFYVFAWDQRGNGAGNSSLHISLDAVKPTSSMSSLPAHSDSSAIHVSWSGSDSMSGIANYDVQVQDNGGSWTNWLSATTKTSDTYYGQLGHSYGFRVRATDNAGNVNAYPGSAQASTSLNVCSTDALEADNDKSHAKPLTLDTKQSHTICGLGDQDWVSLSVQAGKAYDFSTLNLGTDTDTLLSLYDANGNLLAESDDLNGTNLASSILYRPKSNATVYLRIMHTDSRIGGNAVSYDVLARETRLLNLPSIFK